MSTPTHPDEPDEVDEIIVDGRGLDPPEPMELVMNALDDLLPTQRLRFLIHRQPYPLYDILRRYRYPYQVIAPADGGFEILIESPQP